MNRQSVGIYSLAVSFPKTIRTNDYWRENYPNLIAQAEQKSAAKIFSPDETISNNGEVDLWTQEMKPYLSDPFRGAVERRVLGFGESSLTLEYDAASQAIQATNLSSDNIDLMIVTSMFSEQPGVGNAATLAGKLGLQCAVWNLDSMCSSAIVAFQTACALVRTGEYPNVLIVVSCSYSRFVDETDTLAFFTGDGAAAFVVTSLEANQGIISTKIVNTAQTCGAFFNELAIDNLGRPRIFVRADKKASKVFSEVFVKFCLTCCEGAIADAGVTLDQIDFFVFNSLIPWYVSTYTRALGINPERTIDLNPTYGNIGVASPMVNLYHAIQLGKIRKNDLILVYALGGTSNAAATVMRVGNVALGSAPAPLLSLAKDPIGAK